MARKEFKLKNGMHVLLEENHNAKVVSFTALVNVGSVDETDDEAGICHVIEHMLFKGTPKRPEGTIAMEVEAAGGDMNAYTSLDQTVYYINMATRFAAKGLEILADAVMNPLFDSEELKRESEVILEEIRREQDNPSRMAAEYLFQHAYKVHNYRRPIIGYPKTVKSFTHQDLTSFHRRWYTPKNISFIVVGDFNTKKMLSDIEKAFEGFEGDEIPSRISKPEPRQSSPRIIVKEMNVQSTYLSMGFHIPNFVSADTPVLDLLAHILGGTDSSRFEQVVKEKKRLAHAIHCSAYTPKHPGLFYVGAMVSDSNAAKTINAISQEVGKLKTNFVASDELARAKINMRSNEIYEKETVGGQGAKIASFIASSGEASFERTYYQRMAEVTPEDISEAAKKYLNFSSATTVLIVPKKSKWTKNKSQIKSALSSKKTIPLKKSCDKSEPRQIMLKNGAKLIVREIKNIPVVSICSAALGGIRSETRAKNGVSALLARTLTKGTRERKALRIARDIEKIAGSIDGFCGKNTFGVRCEFLSEYVYDGFELFADVLTHPSFEPEEVANEKQILLKAIKDQEDNLSSLAFAKFLQTLYPRHPYGLRSIGMEKSVKSLTRNDLIAHHREMTKASGTVIAVVGDVCTDEIEALANEYLCDMSLGKPKNLALKSDPRPKSPRLCTIKKDDKQQAHIVMGFQGTRFSNRDKYAMTVLNNILSGQGGRLFRVLRDQMSLAYAVSSVNQEGVEPGYFAVYIGTDPSKIDISVDAMKTELIKVCEKKITKEELSRAKQYLVGTYDLELQRYGAIANMYCFYELYHLGLKEIDKYPERIMSVTAEEVLAAAKRYIDIDNYTMAIVKP